jgi:Primase C terminal 2 (PriCT-2)
MSSLTPDREMLAQFAGLMFKHAKPDGFVSLRLFPDKGSKTAKPIDIEAIRIDDKDFLNVTVIRAEQAANWHEPAVFCPPVATFLNHKNAQTNNLCEGPCLSVECDQSPREARATLEGMLGPATAVVESGGEWTNVATGVIEPKVHLHWRLKKPTSTKTEHDLLREARALATRLAGGDATNISIVHSIRWPGSWHRKATPRLAKIVASDDAVEIDLTTALEVLRDAAGALDFGAANVKSSGKLRAANDAYVASALAAIPNDNHDWNYWNTIGMATWAATGGSEDGRKAFHEWSAKSPKNDPTATEARWQHYKTSPPTSIGFGTLVYLARKHSPGWTFGSSLPVAKFGPLSAMADRAAEILLEAKVPFYQRGDKLVRPVVQPVKTFGGNTTHAAQLVEIDIHYLRDMLCRTSQWMKLDQRSRSWKAIHPPSDAAMILLKRFGDWAFPPIAGIITTPTLRPDGTILSAPGYDPATRLLLVDPPPMPSIPDNPTRDDAVAALEFLKGLLREFPFVNNVSRAVALSGYLSTVCRGGYPVVPLHVIDAPVAGSGKSYLLSTVSWISTGEAMPVIGTGGSEQELEKRLGAAVMQGQPLICIDNVVGELGGEALCQLVEQLRPNVRVLGLSKLVPVEARSTTYFANGNNIVIVGDLCRRAVSARLDPGVERPEFREFKGNPMQQILANRGAFIAACLTICRAYIVAGRPNKQPQLASFGEWSDTVRSALVWLGEADPVASLDSSRADDPETSALITMLNEWKDIFGSGPAKAVTLREVIERCERTYGGFNDYVHPGLRAAILAVMPPHQRQKPDLNALGCWMRSKKDRRAGGMWFSMKANNNGPATWWVGP